MPANILTYCATFYAANFSANIPAFIKAICSAFQSAIHSAQLPPVGPAILCAIKWTLLKTKRYAITQSNGAAFNASNYATFFTAIGAAISPTNREAIRATVVLSDSAAKSSTNVKANNATDHTTNPPTVIATFGKTDMSALKFAV
jgi:hypothetical protein